LGFLDREFQRVRDSHLTDAGSDYPMTWEKGRGF
jgi:hypothetical protein